MTKTRALTIRVRDINETLQVELYGPSKGINLRLEDGLPFMEDYVRPTTKRS